MPLHMLSSALQDRWTPEDQPRSGFGKKPQAWLCMRLQPFIIGREDKAHLQQVLPLWYCSILH